jgi:hypothetical protein
MSASNTPVHENEEFWRDFLNGGPLITPSALDDLDANAVKRLPEPHVEIYLHPCLLFMKRVWQLDRDGFRADDSRRTALPREEEGESCAQAFFLWPQKNCHAAPARNVEGRLRSPFAPPSDEPPSSRRIGAQPPKHRAGRAA